MTSFQSKEYEIIPTDTYKVVRNCPGCGVKTAYQSTHKLRVNANGKQLDAWLIYQCPKCKHPFNLTIHSRINRNRLSQAEYGALLGNDRDLVYQYGLDRALFQKNNAEILNETAYVIGETGNADVGGVIRLLNPYRLKLRKDKLVAQCLKIPRAEAIRKLRSGMLSIDQSAGHEIIIQRRCEE